MEHTNINSFDIIIIFILGLTFLSGFINGFIRTIFGLISWIISAIVSVTLYHNVQKFLGDYITNQYALIIVSFLGLFIISLIIMSFLNQRIYNLMSSVIGGIIDRSLGAFCGLIKGGIYCIIIFTALVTILSIYQEDGDKRPEWLVKAKSYKLLNKVAIISKNFASHNQTIDNFIKSLNKSTAKIVKSNKIPENSFDVSDLKAADINQELTKEFHKMIQSEELKEIKK